MMCLPVAAGRHRGGPGNDHWLGGGPGRDKIVGGPGSETTLDGGFGNDQIHGGRGRDRLQPGPGGDDLYGGPGNDFFQIEPGGRPDRIFCGCGRDTVAFNSHRGVLDQLADCEVVRIS
jgi:Ca2+-binding RTX toxin-like protein